MVAFAEQLTARVSHASWAMFCKNGTGATTMALTTARAHTQRRTVKLAKGAYHGAAPWCTPRPAGTTPEDRANQIYCTTTTRPASRKAVARAGNDLAAIFASPFKHNALVDLVLPDPAYARLARQICDRTGAPLVVDDVRGGLRLARDCSWSTVGVQPDLSSWGKCIANGHPISALLGAEKSPRGRRLQLRDGLVLVCGSPMAAGLETLRRARETRYLEDLQQLGVWLRAGLHQRALAHGL